MNARRKLVAAVILAMVGGAVAVQAVGLDETREVAPLLIPFQGALNRDGCFLSGPAHLKVSLFDAQANGNLVWGPEVHDAVLTDGRFSIVLGSVNPFTQAVLGRRPLFLGFEVKVDGLDADFVPLVGRQQLLSAPYAVSSRWATHGDPPGTVSAFAGAAAPYGWLLCDGSEVNRTEFAALFAVISTSYGSSGATTFKLPDYRGRFLRGADNGANVDPDRGLGSAQDWSTGLPRAGLTAGSAGDHVHDFDDIYHTSDNCPNPPPGPQRRWLGSGNDDRNNWPGCTTPSQTQQAGAHTHAVGGGDAETRPINVSVNWIIKY